MNGEEELQDAWTCGERDWRTGGEEEQELVKCNAHVLCIKNEVYE
jgi:hypothetical protein